MKVVIKSSDCLDFVSENYGNQVDLSLEEQSDMNAIEDYYIVDRW